MLLFPLVPLAVVSFRIFSRLVISTIPSLLVPARRQRRMEFPRDQGTRANGLSFGTARCAPGAANQVRTFFRQPAAVGSLPLEIQIKSLIHGWHSTADHRIGDRGGAGIRRGSTPPAQSGHPLEPPSVLWTSSPLAIRRRQQHCPCGSIMHAAPRCD